MTWLDGPTRLAFGSTARAGAMSRRLLVGLAAAMAIEAVPTPLRAQQALNGGTATGPAAYASGAGAIADGLYATATGHNSTVTGDYASAYGENSKATGNLTTAVGQASIAQGNGASAFGQNSTAHGDNATASGQGSVADGYTASAYGQNSRAQGDYATAIGNSSYANGSSATAIGQNAVATGPGATATGSASQANGANASAYGLFALATGDNATAIGASSQAAGPRATATGTNARATGDDATAYGQGSTADGTSATAVGGGAAATGALAAAFGQNSHASGASATAVGTSALANGLGTTAFGTSATASADQATALGQGATASFVGAVAIGQGATTAAASAVTGNAGNGVVFNAGAVAAGGGRVLSVGAAGAERQIQNVAAGAVTSTSTDAINGSQLYGVATATAGNTAHLAALGSGTATALGGGALYDPTTGVTGLGYTLNGSATSYTTVVAGEQALASGAAGVVQYATPGTPSNAVALVGTGGAVTLGNVAAGAVTAGSTEAVNGSQLYGVAAAATGNTAHLAALGSGTATALGGGALYDPTTGLTGLGYTLNGSATSYTTVVAGEQALASGAAGVVQYATPGTPSNAVALAGTGGAVTLGNVAAGAVTAGSTEAVNGAQIYGLATAAEATTTNLGISTATALGGGALYNPVTGVTGLGYALNGSATSYTTVVAGEQALASGAAGVVQYATPGTPSNAVTLVGTGGAVTLGNIAAGAVTAGSTQAVNGSQLYDLASAMAANVTALNQSIVASSKYFQVGQSDDGSRALSDNAVAIGGLATATGAGSIAQGQHAATEGAGAIAIGQDARAVNAGALALGTGALASADPTTAVGADAVASADNASAFGAAAKATAANSLALGQGALAGQEGSVALGQGATASAARSVSSNAALGVFDNAGAVAAGSGHVVSVGATGAARQIQNVAAGAVAADSTDAVNGSQLYSVASNVNEFGATAARAIGGNATYAPQTGISGVHYALDGSGATYTDVVSGQQALAAGAAGPVQYATPGTVSNAVTLVGRGQAVTLGNVAAGAVSATSQQAINGGQLYGAASSVAAALGGGAALREDGSIRAPVYQIGRQQFADVGTALAALQTDTQMDIGSLRNDVSRGFRRANGGISAAMAGNGIRFDDRPGKLSTGIGVATWGGEIGLAGGLGATSENGLWRMNATVTLAPSAGQQPDVGMAGGLSYTLN